MKARKCDCCGKLYELHNIEESEENINQVMTFNEDHHGMYYKHGPYDLCPKCSQEFSDWFFKKGVNKNDH